MASIGFLMWIKNRYHGFFPRFALILRLLKKSCSDLWTDGCFTQAAAISYYLVVSIFPILLLLIGVAVFFLEPHEVQRKVLSWVGQYFPVGTRVVFREDIESIIKARGSAALPDRFIFNHPASARVEIPRLPGAAP
jgi:uncharacterized BrkB/YihY/UPF0761 family membrane protein